MARNVLGLLNAERKANHLPPLKMNARLVHSARAHNLQMARTNTMSHQLPHEAPLGDRITAAGYRWSTAGENIGWNSDMSNNGVMYLEKIMYNERPPGEIGHRLNILSHSFRNVGIDIYYDAAHGKVWLTEDFGHAR